MGQYTSYYLYQKYVKIGQQEPTPVYPTVLSIDGEGTMPLSTKTEYDTSCGYIPPTPEPIYGWFEVSGYVCDECDAIKAMIQISGNTYYVNGTGEISRSEVSGYSNTAENVVITNSCSSIADGAFSGFTAAGFVRIPNTVTTIGNSAFTSCSAMTECQIPYGTTSIGNSAFIGCTSLNGVDIPNTVTSIGVSAFSDSHNFRYVSIPSSVTSIPDYCFYNCDGLSDVELPSSITTIGNSAFAECSGLYSFTVNNIVPPTLGTGAFYNTNNSLKIYVPSTAVNTYKTASGWSSYKYKIYPIE